MASEDEAEDQNKLTLNPQNQTMKNSRNTKVSRLPPSTVELGGDSLENWLFFKLQFASHSAATGL